MAPARAIAYVSAMTQPHRPVGPGDHVFLVDGSSFVFRAYYQSIRQDQKYNYRSDRLPIGAVRLFATKILQFVRDGAAGIKPTHLAIIFDKSEDSFRREIYPAYKGHRPDPPADLVPQFPLMRATVRAFGMIPVEQDRYEADDLIATYARQAREAGADVLIVSADKDLMQLIEPGVAMYDPASGDREERRIGPAEVVEYFGARAGQGGRHPGARRRFDRQRARRARHRRQDRRAAHRRIWRSRNAARPRGRDQAAEAPRGADPAGECRAHPHLEAAGARWSATSPLETPLEALATPKLDGKALIAFFKAMELTTITRRVAEMCGVDASSVEPDPRFVGPAGWQRDGGQAEAPALEAPAPAAATLRPRHRPPLRRRRRRARPPTSSAPAPPRRARRSTARPTRPCGRRRSLPPGSPARRPKGVVAFDAETLVHRPDARRAHRPVARA